MSGKRTRRLIRPLKQERAAAPAPEAPASPPGLADRLIGPTSREEYEAAVLANAVEFTACRFLGAGHYATRRAATLAEARAHADELGRDRSLIYAINAAGRSVLVEAGGKPVKP